MIVGIWAEDERGLIGVKGRLPWTLPAELHHFKQTTMGQIILMGRKTFDGMNQRTLPGRTTVILTHDQTYQVADKSVLVFHRPKDILAWYHEKELETAKDLYIIGGAEIFKAFSQYLDRLYRTVVHGEFEGDTFFSDVIDYDQFTETSTKTSPADEANQYAFTVKNYEKKK